MTYAIVAVPAAPVRRKAWHQSEMTNQLLFGDPVKILKEKGSLWVKVRCLHDEYEGWLTRTLLITVTEEDAKAYQPFVTHQFITPIQLNGMPMQLPRGAFLPNWKDGRGRLGAIIYSTDATPLERNLAGPSFPAIQNSLHQWLNAPYQWGGKTIFGVDCSGFVQVNYKMMGIDLPRDAWQQAQEGETVPKLKDAVGGDLAFFDDKEEIVHVGILLNSDEIIHASGKVRIDKIDKKGIVNADTGKRTHSLRLIKRLW